MESKNINDLYLVPFDFTPITEGALNYGLRLTAGTEDKLVLTHIVKSDYRIDEATEKFEALIKGLSEDDRSRVSFKVAVGSLYEGINNVAEELDATSILMGTHGAIGFQKLWGSNALKVVGNSETPFIITQNPDRFSEISHIVMPFSYAKETVQVVQFAVTLAKKFKASIDLIGYRDSDEWLLKDMKVNQAIISRNLKDQNVEHSIITLPGEKGYEKELLEYANESNADLIAAAYFNESIIPALTGSFLQDMIENKFNVPVLTVNVHTLSKMTASVVY